MSIMLMDTTEIKKLLDEQRAYLNAFYDTLSLSQATDFIQTCLDCSGLIILAGVGKSGIIAEKIAMTLISTGTRALSLPPTNFLHGDIGIISPNDLLILISKSGETEELLHLVPFVKRRGAKVLAMVSAPHSKLSQEADLSIYLPVTKELCPFDLAPTTSTAVQLNFGDILAMALMRAKGITLDEYALSHPAGSIGKKVTLTVEDVMVKDENLPCCYPGDLLVDVLVELSSKKHGCLIIINEERDFLGIFTDGDLRRALQKHSSSVLEQKIETLMTTTAQTIDKKSLAWDAMKLMRRPSKQWISTLPVVEEKKLIGIIRMTDIIQTGL